MKTNNQGALETIPNISYPYKAIYAYFAYFKNIREYKKIKNAVLGINSYHNEYEKYYRFYLIMSSFRKLEEYKDILPFFNIIFNHPVENKVLKLIDEYSHNRIPLFYTKLLKSINDFDIDDGYFLYLICLKIINFSYESCLIIPNDILDILSWSEDINTLSSFFNSYFLKQKRQKRIDILNLLKNEYQKNINCFNKMGIAHIYLFGSIKDNEYHRESDIDLVVDFKLAEHKTKLYAYEYIEKFNKEKFNRKTDIQEYKDFKLYNPDIDLLELI